MNMKSEIFILALGLIFNLQSTEASQYLGFPDPPLPNEVIIKTSSTGLNTNFEYAISEGKLYYKTRKERLNNPITAWTKSGRLDQFETPHPKAIKVNNDLEWHLFKESGIPEVKGKAHNSF